MALVTDGDDEYKSPSQKQLEDVLANPNLPASIRTHVEEALARLDHTNPARVRALLPADALAFYQHTVLRANSLVPLIKHSHDSGCFIESIILDHGLVQFALRGLYVMAWQRAVMPKPLTADALAPFYAQRSKKGDVYPLISACERNGLLQGEQHANHLRMVNDTRNRAAHGVIFGEIPTAELAGDSRKCQWAALGALETFLAWFNNPRPLKAIP